MIASLHLEKLTFYIPNVGLKIMYTMQKIKKDKQHMIGSKIEMYKTQKMIKETKRSLGKIHQSKNDAFPTNQDKDTSSYLKLSGHVPIGKRLSRVKMCLCIKEFCTLYSCENCAKF